MRMEDWSRDVKEMMRMASEENGLDDLLAFGLEWVGRIAPYDLTTIFLLESDSLVVKAANGRLDQPKVRSHVLPLQRYPSVRRILESRKARAFLESDHTHGDGDPFDGVLDLPHGHACMVVPLCAGDQRLGIMTLDRQLCQPYSDEVVNLLEIYGQILAMAIHIAEQNEKLKRLHQVSLERERLLSQDPSQLEDFGETRSPLMRELVGRARQVAKTQTPVLILGETGTGKERLANAIHAWSPRAAGPFVKLNCAAIPENLLESELFGHVKGAFTGATRNRPGRFQLANGGTLLLDEIGEMPAALQAKLLRILQESTFEPVGADHSVKVDVRILAATHVDLQAAIRAKRFREDLYYRLNVFPIQLPPLRSRLEDLAPLCASLLLDLAKKSGRLFHLSDAGLQKLSHDSWPGNVRELANVLERATILARGTEIEAADLDLPRRSPEASHERENEPLAAQAMEALKWRDFPSMEELERRYIKLTLQRAEGKIYGKEGAAEKLALKPTTLQSRIKKLGIRKQTSWKEEL